MSFDSSQRRSAAGPLLVGLAVCGWGLLMGLFHEVSPYAALGVYGLMLLAITALRFPNELRNWLRPSWRGLFVGVLVGAAMVVLTYPAFRLARHLMPGLQPAVEALYVATGRSPDFAIPWLLVIIVAEEVLWRGLLPMLVEPDRGAGWALTISVVSYSAAQACTGSWIVAALAITCGTIWSLQRQWTDSVASALIAHLIWTPTVIVFCPVT